ncbi:hypothetical protein V7S43_013152 [Phytophthora oleae]|uniref:Uncharacterized protein n=1 Tax=Phytophthora oleae TaxID=2107226 RepID=A0ABD3F574_9STRA
MDKSSSRKKFIGECRLPVSLYINGDPVDQWYPINYDSEPVGEIYLRVHLKVKSEMQPVTVVAPATVVAPVYPPPPQPYYQQPTQAYGYPSQPPPPQAYGYQQPPPVAYAAGPPVMVVEERRQYSPDCSPRAYDRPRDYGSPRRYDDGYGRSEPREFSGAQMAMGVGAGVLGGVVLGEVADRVFGGGSSAVGESSDDCDN